MVKNWIAQTPAEGDTTAITVGSSIVVVMLDASAGECNYQVDTHLLLKIVNADYKFSA